MLAVLWCTILAVPGGTRNGLIRLLPSRGGLAPSHRKKVGKVGAIHPRQASGFHLGTDWEGGAEVPGGPRLLRPAVRHLLQ